MSAGVDTNAVRGVVHRFPAWSINRITPPGEEVAVFYRGQWRSFGSWDALVHELLEEAARKSLAQARLRDEQDARQRRERAAQLDGLIGTRGYTVAELQLGLLIGMTLAPILAWALL